MAAGWRGRERRVNAPPAPRPYTSPVDALALAALGLVGALAGLAVVHVRTRRRWRSRLAEAARERTQLEEELRAAQAERRSMDLILSAMREGVQLWSPAGELLFSNPASAALLGSLPRTVQGLLPLGLRRAVEGTMADGTIHVAEVRSHTRQTLRGEAVPVGDGAAVLLVVRDVTEARRLEAVRRDFVANASHELKTPVAAIRATAETLRVAVNGDPEAVPRFAEQLERETVRLSRIVSDLLDLSRLETGSVLGEDVHLDAVAREEVERFESLAAESQLRLTIEAAPVPPVRGSARDLALMVRNLIDNAIRYTRPGGRVDVRVRAEGGRIVLTVADTGIGIPSRDLGRIFERFYRVDRARSRETGGTGLGLSIVRHVVENHGGSVRVASELGRGSTFEVRLPAAGLAEGRPAS